MPLLLGYDSMGITASMRYWGFKFRRDRRALNRRMREWRMILRGVASTDHPVMAHIIPIRRCNLSCAYCNEYDDYSKPVPLDTLKYRLNLLGQLKTGIITLSGGEPLLHPELDEVIRHIRSVGALAGLITNGYFLMPDRIQRLNEAGLDYLQISIDNVMPDDVSKKSLKVLDKKLQMLADHACFHVNINSVLGGGIHNPKDSYSRWEKRSARCIWRCGQWRRAAMPRSTVSRTTSRMAWRTTGAAAPG